MPKAIVLFSDGTGNSAAALFKTNVWRLYQALDLSPPEPGESRQIAYYDDGVGTSAFKLFAVFGGIFGLGLKRNVLDIYTFLCRNYEPGDRIYAFGFSRGAFTIRVLVGLVVKEGLIQCEQDASFNKHAADAYREYRKRYNQTGGLVGPLRWLRDLAMRTWRRWRGQIQYEDVPRLEIDEIAFVGVWDTVAAYGLPLAELTRAIDDWVWPLSMPNYKLSRKGSACTPCSRPRRRARHLPSAALGRSGRSRDDRPGARAARSPAAGLVRGDALRCRRRLSR